MMKSTKEENILRQSIIFNMYPAFYKAVFDRLNSVIEQQIKNNKKDVIKTTSKIGHSKYNKFKNQ